MLKGLFSRRKPIVHPVDKPKSIFTFLQDDDSSERLSAAQKYRAAADKMISVNVRRQVTEFIQIGVAMDSVMNASTSLKLTDDIYGANVGSSLISWYGRQSFIGYQLNAILGQHWLIDKSCTLPAKDAIRKGFKLTVNSGEKIGEDVLAYIEACDKRYRLKKNLLEFLRFGRMFGIRIVLCKIETRDPKTYYSNPFNIDGVLPGTYRGICQIDPYWITPELSASAINDPLSIDYYEPTYWRVGDLRIHKSHLIIYTQSEVADILKSTYIFGGVSIPQKIYERVYGAERTADEAPELAMTKRTLVYKTDMNEAIANQARFEDNLAHQSALRDNFGQRVIDLQEDVLQFDTSLNDFDAMLMTQYQIVAAIAQVPATKLMGTTPKGFNSTGDYEESNYHEELESIQELDLDPLVDRHHLCVMKSEVLPRFNIKPFTITHNWNPLDTPTFEEIANVNKTRAEADALNVQSGAIDGKDVRGKLIRDPDSGYDGLEMSDLPAQSEPPPAQPQATDKPLVQPRPTMAGKF